MTTLRILHLSDTHLMDAGVLHQGTVDTVAAYSFTLESFANAGPLDLVVLSGDVSDDGSPASYRTLRSLTGDFAARHGAVAIYAMGNHDQRAGFREVLGNGHPDSGSGSSNSGSSNSGALSGVELAAQAPIVGISHVAGYRIITVDSSVPGRTHGYVDDEQLAWLRTEMATSYGHGTVVVIHHPPVEPVTALHHGIELMNAGQLAEALAGTDTVAILSGHYHHHLSDVLAAGSSRIPVVVTSGIVNSNDVMAAPGHERAVAGSGGTIITISAFPGTAAERQSQVAPAGSLARVRTLPLRFVLPVSIRPEVVFDLDGSEVERISQLISATRAERSQKG
ncbi:metallophosphoesterase [Specibacter sp. NPDC078692]|uniref:metallophosphoesterase n=1 Tax=Specibacter sp. NPDC078692 TaxID=3155818 RepID=UPI0034271676